MTLHPFLVEMGQVRCKTQMSFFENLKTLQCDVKAVLSLSVSLISTCQYMRFGSNVESISASHCESGHLSILGMAKDGIRRQRFNSNSARKSEKIRPYLEQKEKKGPILSRPVRLLPSLTSYHPPFSQSHGSLARLCTAFNVRLEFRLMLIECILLRRLGDKDDHPPRSYIPSLFQRACCDTCQTWGQC